MSYFRHSGNSIIPTALEHDRHEAPVVEEEGDDTPYRLLTTSQRSLATKRSLALDAQLIAIQNALAFQP